MMWAEMQLANSLLRRRVFLAAVAFLPNAVIAAGAVGIGRPVVVTIEKSWDSAILTALFDCYLGGA